MKILHRICSTIALMLALLVPAIAQDSTRVGIHQMEAELHRWDVLKTYRPVPQLKLGTEAAQNGDIKGAIRLFQKAAPGRPSFAYFNLGVVYFETRDFKKAFRYFKLSYRARRDAVCLEYLQNTERLIKERERQK